MKQMMSEIPEERGEQAPYVPGPRPAGLDATEAECAAVALAPRVSLTDIENAIASQYVFTAHEAVAKLGFPSVEPLKLLTICIIVMSNGFSVIGKSAPASPENFNFELGQKLAREDAIRQLWPLMGFELRERLHREATNRALGPND